MGTFIKFLSSDPIMLGLCIAIIILVIMLIVVLIIGKKKDSKQGSSEDNTSELLKTEVNLETLESTKQYSLDELQGKKELVSPIKDEAPSVKAEENKAVEVPVETKIEPMPLEFNVPEVKSPSLETFSEVMPVPVTPAAIEVKPEVKEEVFSFGEEIKNNNDVPSGFPDASGFKTEPFAPIIESRVEPVDEPPVINIQPEKETVPKFDFFKNDDNIVESKVTPIGENDFHGADSLLDFTTPEEKVVEKPLDSNNSKEDAKDDVFKEPFDFGFSFAPQEVNMFDGIDPIIQASQEEVPSGDVSNSLDNDAKTGVVEKKEDLETILPSITEVVPSHAEEADDDEEDSGDASVIEPYSSIYMDTQSIDLPDINITDFSKTSIMRHIPVMEEMPNNLDDIILPKPSEDIVDDEDDVDLPKLNPSENTNSTLDVLQGESFNIE